MNGNVDPQAAAPLTPEQENTAIKDPQHLKRALRSLNLEWLTLNMDDLVDSMPYPEGHQVFQMIMNGYTAHRQTIKCGMKTETVAKQLTPQDATMMGLSQVPKVGETVTLTKYKGAGLELDEIDAAIRYFISLAKQEDPNWEFKGE